MSIKMEVLTMREILFRGQVKDKDELIGKGFTIGGTVNPISKWVYGVPIPRYPDLFLAWSEGNGEYEEITAIPETIGQYTGLTDKNGTKIFEGDILHAALGNFVVRWSESICSFVAGEKERMRPCMNSGTMKCCEVIGNIFDNPELLE